MGESQPDHFIDNFRTKKGRKRFTMKLLKVLLPLLLVASVSSFSLDALFSSETENKVEEIPAAEPAIEEVDEEEEEEEDEEEEEETLEVAALEEESVEEEEEEDEEDDLSALEDEEEDDEE